MSKTKIEWCDYTINPIKGLCPVDCKDNQGKSYCYARAMYKRSNWNSEIRFDKEVPIYGFPTGSKVFIGSTIELFGDWVKEDWLKTIFANVRQSPDVTFLFLTKQPQNLINWSPFPDNCWVGVSVTTKAQLRPAIWKLSDIQCNKRFLSLEPLLENVLDQILPAEWDDAINWVIVGQQTPSAKATLPKIGWVQEIVEACDKAGIPVFLKNNLRELLCHGATPWAWQDNSGVLRQEFPDITKR